MSLKAMTAPFTKRPEGIEPFLPAKEYELSRLFYQAMGFHITYEEPNMTRFEDSTIAFFINRGYHKDWAENTMVQLKVHDITTWYHRIEAIDSQQFSFRFFPIKDAPYGKTFQVIDPTGILWHITEIR